MQYGKERDWLYEELKKHGIYARRYFYPLITDFSAYKNYSDVSLSIATKASNQVLCLPIYSDLTDQDVYKVIHVIKGEL